MDEDGSGLSTSDETERYYAVAAHLAGFAGLIPLANIVGPLLVWRMGRDKGAYVARQAGEAVNFQITWTLYFIFSALMIPFTIGWLLLPVVALSWLVLMIIGVIKAGNGEPFHYPLRWRPVKSLPPYWWRPTSAG